MKKLCTLLLSILMILPLCISVAADEECYPYSADWQITASSDMGGSNAVTKAFDGDVNTFWHTKYTAEGSTITSHDEVPHKVTIVFPQAISISGFQYTPRPDGMSASGRALAYNFYIAETDADEPKIAMSGDFANTTAVKKVKFPCNVKAKKVIFEITEAIGGYGTMSEFGLMKENPDYETIAMKDFEQYKEDNLLYAIPKNKMVATSESFWQVGNMADRVLDDNPGTFWHEKPGDPSPIYLDIDFNEVREVLGFTYVPRQEPENKGQWKIYNVYAATEPGEYTLVLDHAKMDVVFQDVDEFFDSPVTCRYLRFEIIDFNIHCACAELTFYESAQMKKSREQAAYEKYVLQIGNPVIKVTKGTAPEREITLDVEPYLDNGTTMIPLRGLLTEMGAEIEWDGDTQSITVNADGTKVELQIMNTRVYVTEYRYGRVRYTLKGSAPKIRNDRTFIPLRFLSENLGYNVTWDGATQTITVDNAQKVDGLDQTNK